MNIPNNLALYDLYYIEWVDSVSVQGWRTVPTDTNLRCESIGHLVAFASGSKGHVVVAMNKSHANTEPTEMYGDFMVIPAIAITTLTKVKV